MNGGGGGWPAVDDGGGKAAAAGIGGVGAVCCALGSGGGGAATGAAGTADDRGGANGAAGFKIGAAKGLNNGGVAVADAGPLALGLALEKGLGGCVEAREVGMAAAVGGAGGSVGLTGGGATFLRPDKDDVLALLKEMERRMERNA